MLFLIFTAILKYCIDEKVKAQQGLKLSQGHIVIIKPITESMSDSKICFVPHRSLCLCTEDNRNMKGVGGRVGKVVVVDTGGLLSFPDNSALFS